MVASHPYAVKAHLPGIYVTQYRDLGRRGRRGRARRERVVSSRASRSRSRGCADDGDRRHPTVLRLPAEPARRMAHTSTITHPGADLPPRPRRHRSRQTPPVRYSRPRRTVRYHPPPQPDLLVLAFFDQRPGTSVTCDVSHRRCGLILSEGGLSVTPDHARHSDRLPLCSTDTRTSRPNAHHGPDGCRRGTIAGSCSWCRCPRAAHITTRREYRCE